MINKLTLISRVVRIHDPRHKLHGLAVAIVGVDDPKLMAGGRRFVRPIGSEEVAGISLSQLVVEETYA